MGYSITTKDGITINNIPDDIQPDDPRLKQRVAQERSKLSGGATTAPKSAAAPQAAPDPTEGMSKFDKAMANVGAGASDLILGARQLYTDHFGSDEDRTKIKGEVEEKRRLDKALAKSTDMGILPDWVPTAGDALQVAGATAPTMILPFGAVAKGARALPNAYRALRGAEAVAPTVARLGTGALATDAAITGATVGAFSPVAEGESRAMNMASGAAMSGLTPLAIAGGDSVRRMVTRGGGQAAAADDVARILTPTGDQTVLRETMRRLQNRGAHGDIPLSTAAQLRNAELARLEAGSRTRNGANWYDFDQDQARAVSGAFDRATSSARDLAARRDLRSQNWNTRWTQAEASANAGQLGVDVGRFRQNIDQALRSPEASNPAVRNMLNEIAGEVDRLGPDFSLGHLQQIRANLSGGQRAIPQNAYQGAPRDSMATISVMREVDDILNRATNGRWQDVVSGYARDSQGVNAAKAAGKVREAYYDQATGRVRGVAADPAGDIPKITEAGLGRALDSARGPGKNLMLSPESERRLSAILEALRAQNIVQGVKRSATAGGGSNTASDTIAARAAGDAADVLLGTAAGPAAPVARGVIQGLRNAAMGQKDRALAEALQNPQQMIALIERKIAAGAPLEPGERWLLNTLRNAPAAATAND